jgi:signal transduction histidine kinase
LTQLRYVPYVQFGLIFLFIAIIVITMLVAQRSEQNRLWVGLSKETAHQLGTPISSLNAWQQLLADEYPNDEYVPQMKNDIERLQTIADRFQKIGSEPSLEAQNLIPVVENAVTYMRARISARILIDDSCLQGVERIVLLNAPLLQWVIENLLKNAVDAISGEGTISFRIHENEQDVMLDISDTGKGIDNKTQRRIFEPGFTSKERGWGLGLPLAKRIIEQYHGGKLLLKHSQPGVGTTFRIVLKKPENS